MVAKVHELPEYKNVLPIYEISDTGEVYSWSKSKRGKALKHTINDHGYHLVSLKKRDGKYKCAFIHRLVAIAFVPGYMFVLQVDHKDGNKDRNVPDNLRWVTPLDNARNPNTFQKFVECNRSSHNSKQYEVLDTITGEKKIYPSGCSAARAIGYKSNSFCISKTKGYRSVGKYIVRVVNYEL